MLRAITLRNPARFSYAWLLVETFAALYSLPASTRSNSAMVPRRRGSRAKTSSWRTRNRSSAAQAKWSHLPSASIASTGSPPDCAEQPLAVMTALASTSRYAQSQGQSGDRS